MRPAGEPPDDLRRGLLARELPEVFLGVLDLERALFQVVLSDVVLHQNQPPLFWAIFAQVSRKETMRLKTDAPGRESESTAKYPNRSN